VGGRGEGDGGRGGGREGEFVRRVWGSWLKGREVEGRGKKGVSWGEEIGVVEGWGRRSVDKDGRGRRG